MNTLYKAILSILWTSKSLISLLVVVTLSIDNIGGIYYEDVNVKPFYFAFFLFFSAGAALVVVGIVKQYRKTARLALLYLFIWSAGLALSLVVDFEMVKYGEPLQLTYLVYFLGPWILCALTYIYFRRLGGSNGAHMG